MCLVLLAWKADPRWQLVVAANRDELHARASAPAHWWKDEPDLYAGRDLVAGGTWLGITRGGRFAALTNHRDLRRPPREAESRGALVRDFLAGRLPPVEYLQAIDAHRQRWLPFNLLVADGGTLACLSTEAPEGGRLQVLPAGLHGISNDILDAPWPKVRRGVAAVAAGLREPGGLPEATLFSALADRTVAPDHELPDTGLPLERERDISAAMIVDPVYGTRCSTVLALGHDGAWWMAERSFDATGRQQGEVRAQHPQP